MIEALEKSVVLIKSKKPDNNHFGTAFVIYKSDRFTYLMTCAHVVSDVGGEENVKVAGKDANVILIGTEYDLDIAMLRIEHLLSNSPMLMKSCENTAIQFITAGFYSLGSNTLAEKIEGSFGKEVRLQIKDRAEYDRAWHINVNKGNLLKRGNSGAPVVDIKDGYVVGVLSYREGKGAKGLALSISTLQKLLKLYPTELLDENEISELKHNVIKDDRPLINKILHESISNSKRFEPNLVYNLISMLKPTPRMVAVIGPEINSALTIDDSILFVRSDLQSGWGVKDIELNFQQPIELSDDLRKVAKRNRIELLYPNKVKLMITSIIPPVIDKIHDSITVRINLAPITYFDIRGVELGLDQFFCVLNQSNVTLRKMYFKDHALFSENNKLPNKTVIHLMVITKDNMFLIMQRSPYVEFQNTQWSATFEEQMQGDYFNEQTKALESGDKDFFSTALRGITEELGVSADRQNIRFFGISSEYENLAYNVLGLALLNLDSSDIINAWKLLAKDKAEHSRLVPLPFEQDFVFNLLKEERLTIHDYGIKDELWHPSSRMRILLGAIYLFNDGI